MPALCHVCSLALEPSIPEPGHTAQLVTAAALRLRRHAEFQRVYGAARKQHGKQMSFFAALREVGPEEYAGPRVGLTVGKVMGKAHVRNRIKRRLREAVRVEQAALGGLPVDVVLHPRKTVETLPFAALRAEVAGVFRRVNRMMGSGDSAGQRASESARTQPSHTERGETGAHGRDAGGGFGA